ncbi:PadR family transcriptional regulator [Naasia lichenicola]|uniref:PadR family transcriptional regulator n=2 Tax=Naasia lichenicola TaxID=2565933 RepID=A0A4S4FLJ9_9MICO|nr:PadR family transcriptional regulator [Naasia lichenicola]
MHPYEMYQLLVARAEDRLVKIRPGSLYHAVVRLADRGLLAEVGRDREGNRPERTTYSLTEAGRTALVDWVETRLSVPTNEYPEFPVAVAQMHNLPEGEVVQVLDRRLVALRAELDFHGELIAAHTAIELHEPYWLDTRYQHAMLAAQIHWIEQLLDDLRSGRLVWQDPQHQVDHAETGRHDISDIAHEGASA